MTDQSAATAPEQSPFASLVPDDDRLLALADALIARQRRELTTLIDNDALPAQVRDRLATALEALPAATGAQDEAAVALTEVLWSRISGRDAAEQLASLLIGSGIAVDAIANYRAIGGTGQSPVTDLAASFDATTEALQAWFELDTSVSGRLAMWSRRVAGDTVVWSRELAGIEPGMSADSLVAGAETGAETFAGELFSQHSRRMSALQLAA